MLAVLTVRDVTEKKRTENALMEAVRARDEFLSIASHELKTPLTTLTLQGQIRKRQITQGKNPVATPEGFEKMVDSDLKQLGRLNRLIEDMLDDARIRTGKLEISRKRVDLCTLAQEVAERFRPQLVRTSSELRIQSCEPTIIEADPFRLEQMLTNLLTNALKYGQGRPIELAVSRHRDDYAYIRVTDQGIGIAPRDLSRIFSRFERAVSANEISGLGLGLAIARDIVEAHGGQILVQSEVGKGSTFTVELPLNFPVTGNA
jgi:signal transduction histidine kinase